MQGDFKLNCPKCGQSIECPAEARNQLFTCPSCLNQIVARTGDVATVTAALSAKKRAPAFEVAAVILCFVVGCGLVLTGCMSDEKLTGPMQYCAGFITILLSMILGELAIMRLR